MSRIQSSIISWVNAEAKVLRRTEEIMAGVIVTRATVLAPKLTGALQGDGRVEVEGNHHTARFGGTDVPYARRRHFENKKNPQTLNYLKRAGDSVAKENIKKYVDMAR